MLSGEAPKRKKPHKKKRAPAEETDDQKVTKQIPNASSASASRSVDPTDPRQKLRDRIKSMQKDRQRGSQACEENANHEY